MATVLKKGRWYHEYKVPVKVFIVSSSDDPKSDQKALYYVHFEALGDPGTIGEEAGPFHSEDDAVRHAELKTNGTLRWS